jgi:hypothetical protein
MNKILFRTQIALRRLHRCMAEQQLDLLQFAAGRPAQLGAGAARIVRRIPGTPATSAYRPRNCQTTFSLRLSPQTSSPRFTGRNTKPSVMTAAEVQASIAIFVHVGIGIVRMRTRPCLPTRSTMHHRLSRCCMCLSVSAATSDRRSPQPSSTASIARSRRPFLVASGAFRRAWACRRENQFPTWTPFDFAPFTREMPAASSGANKPLSAALTASFRTAEIRTLMETDPSPRASSTTRQAETVAFVKPGRGSFPNHSMNSSSARL